MDVAELLESFVAAVQASLSVLLVIAYGGVAAWLGLLDHNSTKAVSKVCVRLFLPALLFTKIGAELHAGSAARYGVVLVWAIVCHGVSFVLGIAGHLLGGFPDWTTAAVMFNNTTSYPLLLVAALAQTGILEALAGPDETTAAALERAKSYFLVFSTVSSCLTFAVGPRLIDTEHAPEVEVEEEEEGEEAEEADAEGTKSDDEQGPVTEEPHLFNARNIGDDDGASLSRTSSRSSRFDPLTPMPRPLVTSYTATEQTSLLPATSTIGKRSVVRFKDPFASSNTFFPSTRKRPSDSASSRAHLEASAAHISAALNQGRRRASVVPRRKWQKLGTRTRWWLLFFADFFNAPLLGALAGAVVGLTPALHRAFFSAGGLFAAWLTASLDDIGGLFVPLPVVIAGVSLYTSIQDVRRRSSIRTTTASVAPSALAVVYILLIRFVIWPLMSVGAVYVLASNTTLLGDDPMLWFALMLMPTGPPAMKLITLVQVSNAGDADEANIAKLLTTSYLVSPVLSVAVVGSLWASLASVGGG